MEQLISILDRAAEFREILAQARKGISDTGISWYPYDGLSNLCSVERLLNGASQSVLQVSAGGPVLDVGCADGDTAFYLEHLGFQVHAIDSPLTNFNAMRGVHALKSELRSGVRIISTDLDS